MPTILEAAGIDPVYAVHPSPTRPMIHGRSLIGLLREGRDRWDRPIVIENVPQAAIDGSFYEERALRLDRYKLVMRKFVNYPPRRPGELYDLEADPGETVNLYDDPAHRQARRGLGESLAEWAVTARDPLAAELGAWAAGS